MSASAAYWRQTRLGASYRLAGMIRNRFETEELVATSEETPRAKAVEEAFARNYPQVQYLFVEFVSDHLTDLSRVFNGDLQYPVLLAVIGQITIKNHIAAGDSGRRVHELDPQSIGLTSFRLADATGIPRETVRRKLLEMRRRGWLERHGNYWALAFVDGRPKLLDDLGDLDARGLKRLARLHVGVSPWVSR